MASPPSLFPSYPMVSLIPVVSQPYNGVPNIAGVPAISGFHDISRLYGVLAIHYNGVPYMFGVPPVQWRPCRLWVLAIQWCLCYF